jgi:hypothetical protein
VQFACTTLFGRGFVIASQLTGPIAAMSSSVGSRMRGAVATNSFSKNHVGARLKNPVTNMNRSCRAEPIASRAATMLTGCDPQ